MTSPHRCGGGAAPAIAPVIATGAAHTTVLVISDEALMAFASWCHINARRYVGDPVVVRRVFDAYAGLPDSDGAR